MVLNTSFNGKGQPIVESPRDAVLALLAAQGSISVLYMGRWEVRLRPFPLHTTGTKEEGATVASDFSADVAPTADEADIPVFAQVYIG